MSDAESKATKLPSTSPLKISPPSGPCARPRRRRALKLQFHLAKWPAGAHCFVSTVLRIRTINPSAATSTRKRNIRTVGIRALLLPLARIQPGLRQHCSDVANPVTCAVGPRACAHLLCDFSQRFLSLPQARNNAFRQFVVCPQEWRPATALPDFSAG